MKINIFKCEIRQPQPDEINEVRNFCPFKIHIIPYFGLRYELRAYDEDNKIIRFNFFEHTKGHKVLAYIRDTHCDLIIYTNSHDMFKKLKEL